MECKLRALGGQFLDMFTRINAVPVRHIAPLPLNVSTITFTGTLSAKALPVEAMRLAAEISEALGEPAISGFSLDCDLLKRKRRTENESKRFRYQLPLKRNGKSLKLFHNGSVHATGCTSPVEFVDMIRALTDFVTHTASMTVSLESFDIQLINALFLVTCPHTGRPLAISPRAFLRHAPQHADFDTERHPSVKMKCFMDGQKVATVCVFPTGSVSIMGAKRPVHVAHAYDLVCRALDGCASEACTPAALTMRTTTARHPLTLVEGYPLAAYFACASL